jgi:hypothetical protein
MLDALGSRNQMPGPGAETNRRSLIPAIEGSEIDGLDGIQLRQVAYSGLRPLGLLPRIVLR